MNPPIPYLPLEEIDRRELLRIARIALKEWLRIGRLPPGAPHRPTLLSQAGAFVSLQVDGTLRGCLGQTDPETPLYRTVSDLAIGAATRDARFATLQREEIPRTRITISILSPRERVSDLGRVEVGQHGLVITRGEQRGLLLPQVATDHKWDRDTFLGETCRKAGLAAEAWREPDIVIERFTADVFSDPS
jgi:AmmeMemoRadiSam system protein A